MEQRLNLKVLVVDDNRINRLLIEKVLTKWGVFADFVENGLLGVEKIENNRDYDVVLMDIHMPEMGGIEATRTIRNMPDPYFKQLPIIALTASMLNNERDKIDEAGMDYILKPFESKKLYEKLSTYQKETAALAK
jgi:CheY-like chemotaxis protein